jgi:trans-aconitate 2-methyltransferase
LSTATFHWLRDHDRLFGNLAAVLRPGGQLAAQCGGAGNLASVASVLRDLGVDPFGSKTYATAEETAERLERSGFVEVECWLHPEPTPFPSIDDLGTYLRTVVLGDHVEQMAEADAAAFASEVAGRLPALELDYVRLNVRGRRG